MATEAPTRAGVRLDLSNPRVVANTRVNVKNPYSRKWATQSGISSPRGKSGSDDWCESHAINAAVAIAGNQYSYVIHKSTTVSG